jgi:lysophospholipase L1-like esterase
MGAVVSSAAEPPLLEPAEAWTARDGLPNVRTKLEAGGDVTVVFIGGSITVGGGQPCGYVTFVGDWLGKNYPKAKVNVLNAGCSGTGSYYGAKRLDRDVLCHNPDLILIEFCVNDGDRDMTTAMERIVHKAWLKNPRTDLLIFYTLRDDNLPHYQAGNLPPSASAHEHVAAFYGIPTVGTARAVAEKVNDGTIQWKDFSGDGCHPNANGYALFNAVFAAALPELLKSGTPEPHVLGKSITPALEVYPPAPVAEPLPAVEAVTDAAGIRALHTYCLPAVGKHWVETADFTDPDGKPLWRISWMTRPDEAAPTAELGADRAAWDANLPEWFAEDKTFTGPSGIALLQGDGALTNRLGITRRERTIRHGMTPPELAVLRFLAPATGRYAVRVRADGISMWKNEGKTMTLNILRFSWNSSRGIPVALLSAVKKTGKEGIETAVELSLAAGEELVFIPGHDAGPAAPANWTHFGVTIGYFEK